MTQALDDQGLLRYSRQILLPQFDIAGQERLLTARVLIVGAGGLGGPAALYLAGAGVGHLSIADGDRVELSNLQRQILHRQVDLGRPKARSAADTLKQFNPDLQIHAIEQRLTGQALDSACGEVDLVIDASDNFTTRFAINRVCVEQHVPLVSGAAIRMEGQLSVFPNDDRDAPCYRCLYSEDGADDQSCSENGVLSPIVGVIGSLQAVEAIKQLTGVGQTLAGQLLLYDGMSGEFRRIRLPRDPQCPVCGIDQQR